jgi:hypothetical protein
MKLFENDKLNSSDLQLLKSLNPDVVKASGVDMDLLLKKSEGMNCCECDKDIPNSSTYFKMENGKCCCCVDCLCKHTGAKKC